MAEHDGRAKTMTLRDLLAEGRSVTSVENAGKILGLGRGTAFKLARNGEIKTLKFGERYVVPVAWLADVARAAGVMRESDVCKTIVTDDDGEID